MPARSTSNPSKASAQPALDDNIQDADAPPAAAYRAKIDEAIMELRGRAAQVAQETLDNLRVQARPYVTDASQHLQTAERYLVDRVQRQPLTSTLAALGVGVVLGLLLAGGRRN